MYKNTVLGLDTRHGFFHHISICFAVRGGASGEQLLDILWLAGKVKKCTLSDTLENIWKAELKMKYHIDEVIELILNGYEGTWYCINKIFSDDDGIYQKGRMFYLMESQS